MIKDKFHVREMLLALAVAVTKLVVWVSVTNAHEYVP